jgi:hypothetical protein
MSLNAVSHFSPSGDERLASGFSHFNSRRRFLRLGIKLGCSDVLGIEKTGRTGYKKTPWSESASEQYRPSHRRLSAK